MKTQLLVASFVTLLLAGCSSVQVQRTPEFESADVNRDGRVQLSEWLRFGGAEASFLAADYEHKGWLDEAQFRQALRLNDEATGDSNRQMLVLDGQIRSDVQRAFQMSREVAARNIAVEVYQGNVTLSGPVRSPREKQTAEQIASGIAGVKAVFNQLVIRQ